ncbi:MAG: hypothetical protein GX051_09820 [Clostridiales bacterium]|nr:hypothetical protein [Clostridiales bacterium]
MKKCALLYYGFHIIASLFYIFTTNAVFEVLMDYFDGFPFLLAASVWILSAPALYLLFGRLSGRFFLKCPDFKKLLASMSILLFGIYVIIGIFALISDSSHGTDYYMFFNFPFYLVTTMFYTDSSVLINISSIIICAFPALFVYLGILLYSRKHKDDPVVIEMPLIVVQPEKTDKEDDEY